MNCFTCSHGENSKPISYWCNGNCWEAKGSSSRFIEQYMKGISAVGRMGEAMPIDSQDFGRCVDILNLHPEWIPRLKEFYRLKGFTNWKRLVRSWDTFMMLYNDLPHNKSYKLFNDRDRQKFSYFSYLLQGITTDHGLLLTHKLKCNSELFNFKLKNYFVVGSLVLQEKNQDDEHDLYTSFVIDVFPEDMCCERYNSAGVNRGWTRANSYLPRNIKNVIESTENTLEEPKKTAEQEPNKTLVELDEEFVKVIDEEIKSEIPSEPPKCTIHYPRKPVEDTPYFRAQELVKKLHAKMNNYIQSDPTTWQTTNYHYCPHYILWANGETPENTPRESFEMFYADVYPLDETAEYWKLGTCIVSLTSQHKLHPLNKGEDDFEVIFNDEKWVLSSNPIKLYTYYDEGLVNCAGNEIQEFVTDEDIRIKIKINVAENIKLEAREKEINDNSRKNPVQNFGFVSVSCG